MTDNMMDKEFVEYVVKMLVDNPDDVKVERKIDELGEILDRVDVVVGRGRDEGDALGRMSDARDVGDDLAARELAAFARL